MVVEHLPQRVTRCLKYLIIDKRFLAVPDWRDSDDAIFFFVLAERQQRILTVLLFQHY